MDFLPTKGIEYLLVLGYLVVLIPFWRLVLAGKGASAVTRAVAHAADMFRVPADVWFHPGHAWARPDGAAMAVGLDDFAQQLVGPIAGISAPALGAMVSQGERLATVKADSRSVDLLSPVSGRVVARNDAVCRAPGSIHEDPYGRGWLIKVQTPRFGSDRPQLLSGDRARRWMNDSWDELSTMLTPELGTILHDGGTPVQGFARGIDEARWDEIARRFLLSE